MELLLDYVKWRNDLSFEEDELNVVDTLLFCQFSYLNLLSVGDQATIRQAYTRLSYKDKIVFNTMDDGVNALDVLEQVALSKRFGDVAIDRYEYVYLYEDQMPFQALTLRLSATEKLIVLGGTDANEKDWREDLWVSSMPREIHREALAYVEEEIDSMHTYYIVGHSKGASLALYVSSMLDAKKQGRIGHIYLHDGPGVCEDVLDSSRIDAIASKVTKCVPEFGVLGRLYDYPFEDVRIVKSYAKGLLQHSLNTWCLDGLDVACVPFFSEDSSWLYGTLRSWLENGMVDERERFISRLLEAMSQAEMYTVNGMAKQGVAALENVFLSLMYRQEEMEQAAYSYSFAGMFKHLFSPRKQAPFFPKGWAIEKLISLGMIVFGFILLLVPSATMDVFVAGTIFGVTFVEFALVIQNLFSKDRSFGRQRERWIIGIIFLSMSLFILTKKDEMYVFGTLLFGMGFLFNGVRMGRKFWVVPRRSTRMIMTTLEMCCSFIYGLYILMAMGHDAYWFTMSAGLMIAFFGGLEIIDTAIGLGVDLIVFKGD